MEKLNNKKICVVFITVLFVVLIVTRILYVNIQYPQVQYRKIKMQCAGEMKKDVTMQIDAVKEYTDSDMKQQMTKQQRQQLDIGKNTHIFVVRYTIKNLSEKKKKIELWKINLDALGYSTASDIGLNDYFFPGEWLTNVTLAPKETCHTAYAYIVFAKDKDSLAKLKKDGLYLVYKRYPLKTMWLLEK